MRKDIKIWLITAASFIIVGGMLFTGAMFALNWDFTKLDTGDYAMDTHEITETFSHISVDVQTSNIIFALSDDGRCRVECYEDQNAKHSVTVQNNTLVIKSSSKPWYKYIGFN